MAEESQFHMTVVTQKRVLKRNPQQAEAEKPKVPATDTPQPSPQKPDRSPDSRHSADSGHGTAARQHSREGSGAHRRVRHYNDFGTVELGTLEGPHEAAEAREGSASEPSRGQLQREFYHKYDSVLNRHFETRDKKKTPKLLIIAVLLVLILLLSLVGIGSLNAQVGESLERPQVETIPVVTLDLG